MLDMLKKAIAFTLLPFSLGAMFYGAFLIYQRSYERDMAAQLERIIRTEQVLTRARQNKAEMKAMEAKMACCCEHRKDPDTKPGPP